jgi:hypothetical protein
VNGWRCLPLISTIDTVVFTNSSILEFRIEEVKSFVSWLQGAGKKVLLVSGCDFSESGKEHIR